MDQSSKYEEVKGTGLSHEDSNHEESNHEDSGHEESNHEASSHEASNHESSNREDFSINSEIPNRHNARLICFEDEACNGGRPIALNRLIDTSGRAIQILDALPERYAEQLSAIRDSLFERLGMCLNTKFSFFGGHPDLVADFLECSPKAEVEDLIPFLAEKLNAVFDPVKKIVYVREKEFDRAMLLKHITEHINNEVIDSVSIENLDNPERVDTTLTYADYCRAYIDLVNQKQEKTAIMLELMYQTMLRPEIIKLIKFEDLKYDNNTLLCWNTACQINEEIELDIFTYRKLAKYKSKIYENDIKQETETRRLFGKEFTGSFIFHSTEEQIWYMLRGGFGGKVSNFSYTPIDLMLLRMRQENSE